jgi:uncharacterized small protein (DUF1192 family)
MEKLLLTTVYDAPGLQLVEQDAPGGGARKVIMRGEFALADNPNKNNRVYPHALWEREISRLRPLMKDRKLFGCLDHPADGRTRLNEVSHIITDLRCDGGKVIGEAEVLDTERGNNLRSILKSGAKVGISSRGFGSLAQEGDTFNVNDDFRLLTFDAVSEPADSTWPEEIIFNEEMLMGNDELRKKLVEEITGKMKEMLHEEVAASVKLNQVAPLGDPVVSEAEKDKAVASLKAEIERVTKLANTYRSEYKNLGFKLFLNQQYGRSPKAGALMAALGDLGRFSDINELTKTAQQVAEAMGIEKTDEVDEKDKTDAAETKKKLEVELTGKNAELEQAKGVIAKAQEQLEVIKRGVGEADEKEAELTSEVSRLTRELKVARGDVEILRNQVAVEKESATSALGRAKKAQLMLEAEKQISHRSDVINLRNKLGMLVESGDVSTNVQLREWVNRSPDTPGPLLSRVQQGMRRGVTLLNEDVVLETRGTGRGTAIEQLTGMSMERLAQLSGED